MGEDMLLKKRKAPRSQDKKIRAVEERAMIRMEREARNAYDGLKEAQARP